MSVSSTLNRVAYLGTGTANPLPVAFPFQATTDLRVVETVVATGAQTAKAITTDYTVSGTPDANGFYPNGGTVTPTSVIPAGRNWIIFRDPALTQLVHLVDNDSLPASSIENPFDKLTMIVQRLADRANFSVHAPDGDNAPNMALPSAAVRASSFLGFDASGNVSLTDLSGVAAVVATTSLEVWVSKSASLASADAAAVIVGGILVVDTNVTLAAPTTLAAKAVHFRGGVITRGSNNLIINGSVTAPDVAIFDKAGTGTVTFGLGSANATWFGVSRNGATDDTAALNRAFASCKSVLLSLGSHFFTGTLLITCSILGIGQGAILKPGNNTGVGTVTASNVSIRNLAYTGPSNGFGIKVGTAGAVTNIVIEDVAFSGGVQNAVHLHACSNVWVNRCTFDHISFGVLQELGYTCSAIKITNCVASDMLATFATFNGAGTLGYDILIDGNTYIGANNWTSPQTNQNFVDITTTNDVRITNNWIQNTAGDSAIHMEDAGSGRCIIQGNMLFDCNVSGGVDGWIGIFQSSKICTITDNWFVKTLALTTGCYAVTTSSGGYGNPMIISRNYIIGTGNTFGGLNLTGHTGKTIVSDNFASGLSTFADVTGATDKQFRGNTIQSTVNGFINQAATGGGINIEITNNTISCTTKGIVATATGGGTNKPTGWCIFNNNVTGAGGVSITDGVNCFHMGNRYPAGLAGPSRSVVNGTPTNCVDKNNFLDGAGLVNP